MFEMPKISTDQLSEKIAKNPNLKLLDVRTPQEYEQGHIKQAENFPLEKIQEYKGDKDQTLYVICRSSRRSEQAAQMLSLMGYDVYNVAGGMLDWHGEVVE